MIAIFPVYHGSLTKYAKTPRHTSQNSIAAGNLKWIFGPLLWTEWTVTFLQWAVSLSAEKMTESIRSKELYMNQQKLSERAGRSDHRFWKRKQGAPAVSSQLLCALLQLCTGISVQIFWDHSLFFIIQIFLQRRSTKKGWRRSAAWSEKWIFIHPVKLVEGTYDPQIFSGWQKGWSRFPKEESGVFAVIVSAWRRRRSWQRKAVMIILQPLCPSASEKCA